MSRQYNARVGGTLEVEMVCDECGKEEWLKVEPRVDDIRAEYDAVGSSDDWSYVDDCLVCSDKCAQAIWDGNSWYPGVEFDG